MYTGKESEAFLISKRCRVELTVKTGLHVYSPIVDSHPVWQYILENNLEKPVHNFWLNRDLAILEALKSIGVILVFYEDTTSDHYGKIIVDPTKSKGATIEWNWVQSNNIRCVTYESVINNPKNQELWEDVK